MQVNNSIFKYRYLIVVAFTVISFLVTYTSLQVINDAKYNVRTERDSLSGEEYSTAGIYNYKDNNPYGSYFVGFNQLTDRGIRNEEWIYISDALINFTMYNQKIYNGKISFVEDSFVRNQNSGSFSSYSYEFGINDNNIYTVDVQSSWIQDIIRISISDDSDKKLFFKEFKIH